MPNPVRTRLSHRRLLELLRYDKRTGHFTWRTDRGKSAKAGELAGTLQSNGQRQITVAGQAFLANRLAWFYVNGKLPEGRLSFVDGNPANNSWNNIVAESERFSTRPAAEYQRRRRALLKQLTADGSIFDPSNPGKRYR